MDFYVDVDILGRSGDDPWVLFTFGHRYVEHVLSNIMEINIIGIDLRRVYSLLSTYLFVSHHVSTSPYNETLFYLS